MDGFLVDGFVRDCADFAGRGRPIFSAIGGGTTWRDRFVADSATKLDHHHSGRFVARFADPLIARRLVILRYLDEALGEKSVVKLTRCVMWSKTC